MCVPTALQVTILDGLSNTVELSEDAVIKRNSLKVAPLVGKKEIKIVHQKAYKNNG